LSLRPHPDALFGRETITWRVNREGVLLLGGQRALLMQVANPKVAAGVADHSGFESDPFGRLQRTLKAMTRISFGPPEVADRELRALATVHDRVRGQTTAGVPYAANEPELLWWVLATLIDTALAVEERYLGRLSLRERQRYYEESRRIIDAFLIPHSVVPPTHREFRDWIRDECASFEISETGQRLARAILRPPVPFVPPPIFDLISVVTADLLPRPLREAYGLALPPVRTRVLRASQVGVRAVLPRLPVLVRTFPQRIAS
jgi:uncharacterized protein (DUF2236 family)